MKKKKKQKKKKLEKKKTDKKFIFILLYIYMYLNLKNFIKRNIKNYIISIFLVLLQSVKIYLPIHCM